MDATDARALPGRIENLLDGLAASADPSVSALADDLVSSLLALYGAGLERVVGLLDDAAVRRLTSDELVAHLLLLHGLHPDDIDTRIQAALDRVRPYLGSHAGGIDYLGVVDGVARLRLEGSCDHCPSSSVTVNLTVEQAVLDAAPEVERVDVENMVAPRDPPVLQIKMGRPAEFAAAHPAGEPRDPTAQWQVVDVDTTVALRRLDGSAIVLAVVDGGPLAFVDSCARCAFPLSDGTLADGSLSCGGCGARFDLRHAGREFDGATMLDPRPMLAVDQNRWRIALPEFAT